MAAMVQTYPQQTGTVTMLQTRPSSASGIMHGHSQSQSLPTQQYMAHPQHIHRNSFNGLPGVAGQASYRGSSTTGPIQPYAFTATPTPANGGQWQSYGAYRTTSNPNVPTMQTLDPNPATRPRYHANASTTSIPNASASANATAAQRVSRDDSSLPSLGRSSNPAAPRPQSIHLATPTQPTFAQVAAAKTSPERYRRPSPRHADSSASQQYSQQQSSATPSGSGMATVVHLYNPRAAVNQKIPRNSATLASRPHSTYDSLRPGVVADDMMVPRQPTAEEVQRFRRRSVHTFDSSDYPNPLTPQEFKQKYLQQAEESSRSKTSGSDKDQKLTARVGNGTVEKNNAAIHTRTGSSESLSTTRSSNSRPSSSANRSSNASAPITSPSSTYKTDEKLSNPDSKLVNIPPRTSSSDAAKRVVNPSPLSKPVTMEPASSSGGSPAPAKASAGLSPPTKPPGSAHGSMSDSPAAKHLAAINEKGGRPKSKTSRLRRAFSFGSAAELKAAAAAKNNDADSIKAIAPNEPSKLHKEPQQDEFYEAEQARIAKKQEESGLGNSIYSGTKIFAGSTDNLSISSTASSASIMLRKMGRGMKKSGRSLAGLFRPKSVIGTPTGDDSLMGASQPAVSMITVEAERERVNVNANADLDAPNGGTTYPHLERNSLDAIDAVQPDSHGVRLGSSGTDNSGARKSILGGEKERAEVLATIRKGILKTRSNSPSPQPRVQDAKSPTYELPMIPSVADSPSSSAPSTPNEEGQGHRRSGSVAIGNEDYFMSALRLRQDAKSAAGIQGGIGKRNATFSPRIVFYDTWPSQEYDRRGEIATCNRLTPMLAQQIKEELNTFKMEMEVHETSKIYTHFF